MAFFGLYTYFSQRIPLAPTTPKTNEFQRTWMTFTSLRKRLLYTSSQSECTHPLTRVGTACDLIGALLRRLGRRTRGTTVLSTDLIPNNENLRPSDDGPRTNFWIIHHFDTPRGKRRGACFQIHPLSPPRRNRKTKEKKRERERVRRRPAIISFLAVGKKRGDRDELPSWVSRTHRHDCSSSCLPGKKKQNGHSRN